ncbi:MAG TPA: aldose 1-epimerase [Casimicrobiaceae bacterium]|nr:aldose 1-epimerase [Casimicrobiaceae bacterium]
MIETIELFAGSARAVIAPAIGGSIAAFQCGGQAILRPTPSRALAEGAVRDFACFPLIPFSNRIADATLHWAGREYGLTRYIDAEPHAIHGNGWQRAWSVTRREASRLAIELEHDAAGVRAREWPFPYRARQRFGLIADASAVRLELGLEIENTGSQPFPFGLGWHPYFHRDRETELGFAARGVWHTHPSRLPVRFDAVPPKWNFDPPRPIGASVIDNCFGGWRRPVTVRWPARKLTAEIAAEPACDYLVVFVPSDKSDGKSFFAIEPVTHVTDAFNRSGAARDKGTRVLTPGACFSCTMSILVSRDG